MFNNIRFQKLIFLFIAFILFFQCTHNPFGSDNISDKASRIKGKITLSDGALPDGIYVWLEGADAGTYTDKNGEFQLTIPSPNNQPGGGLTGLYKIYFFLANYEVATAEVILRRGELQLDEADIDKDGNLKENKKLQKILDINITLNPNSYPVSEESVDPVLIYCGFFTGFEVPLSVTLAVEIVSGSVTLKYPNSIQGPVSVIIFEKLNTDPPFVKMLSLTGSMPQALTNVTISDKAKVWMTAHQLNPDFLPKGNYRVIPYLMIPQQNLPDELLDNFVSDLQLPGLDILNIPIKIKGGILQITK